MVEKKNSQKDIFKKSPLFFGIGICLSLLLVITAFEWKFYNDNNFVDLGKSDEFFNEILDIPLTQQEPPPPPLKKKPPVIEEVPEEEIIEDIPVELDLEMVEDDIMEVFIASEPEEEEVEEILTIAEEMPSPVGGYPEFYKFVAEEIKYPPMARKAGIEGKVILEITIDKEGKLTNAAVIKGIGFGCDDEALRVIQLWEKWNPGKQRGVPRTIRMYVPMVFQFTN